MTTFPPLSLDVEVLVVPDFVAAEDDVLGVDVEVPLLCCEEDTVVDAAAFVAEVLSEILGVEGGTIGGVYGAGAMGGVYGILPLTDTVDGVLLP